MKTKDGKGSGANTHGQRQEAWKTAGSCGVMKSSSSSTDRPTVTVRVFWVTVGRGPQCCNGETFGPPIKGCILYCKRLAIQLVGQSVSYSDI